MGSVHGCRIAGVSPAGQIYTSLIGPHTSATGGTRVLSSVAYSITTLIIFDWLADIKGFVNDSM